MPLKKVKEPKVNVTVTEGTKDDQEVLVEGKPIDHVSRHFVNEKTVGMNVGITKNMENYESLRVDCWATDYVGEKETYDEAYTRLLGVVSKNLEDVIKCYV